MVNVEHPIEGPRKLERLEQGPKSLHIFSHYEYYEQVSEGSLRDRECI